MPRTSALPERFRGLARRSRRNQDASRATVSVLRAASRVSQTLEPALARADLTVPQFNILMELAAEPAHALPLYELNARLISTPPSTSWLTNRMQDAGLVTKAKDPQDARVVILSLTEAGWEALERALPLVSTAERELLTGFSVQELQALAVLLQRLLRG